MKKTLVFAASAACAIAAYAGMPVGDEIVFEPAFTQITVSPGDTFDLPLLLNNTVECVAFEWTIEQNDAISVVFNEEEDDYMVNFMERLTSNYVVSKQYHEKTDDFKVIVVNMAAMNFMPTESGPFCTMTFKVDDEAPVEMRDIKIMDPVFNWIDTDGEVNTYTGEPMPVHVNITDPTGIDAIDADSEGEPVYYDLTGRRVKNPDRGLYIRDGKKVIL